MKRLVLAALLSWLAYVRTDGFHPSRIHPPFLFQGSDPFLTEETLHILSQPFRYLSRGRQCFVFESQDGKYVIKFFNQTYLRNPFFPTEKRRQIREKRRYFYEHSYPLAFRMFGEEITHLHLHKTLQPLPLLSIVDQAKGEYLIDLNQTPFVLQKKAIPFYTALQKIYEQEGERGLKREIERFKVLIQDRIGKQIADGDSDIEHNWGYVEGKLVHIDPGRLYVDETLTDPKRKEMEWEKSTRPFQKWVEAQYSIRW